MKHAKHAQNEIYSSTKKKNQSSNTSRDIYSKTPKSKIILDIISKILFPVEMMVVIALILYATLIQIFPILYIFIFIVLLGVLAGVHIKLLSGKKRRVRRKRILSLCLSVAMFVVSGFGMSYMGILNGAIGDISLGAGENANQVKNVAKDPFIVYLSGVDTKNATEIKDKDLSDVNIVVVINPEQKRVLLVSTPRDYYVPLEGNSNKMDKLTHAGTYGIDCSIKTLETLYDVEFNYYAKVNFKSVYDIVNSVGGVTINSDYAFDSHHSYTGKTYSFKKGENFVMGDAALAFVRERKLFAGGDRQRGKNQQELISAVVNKAISPAMFIPANIEDMLEAVSNNTKTNFSEKEIKKLISYQMSSMTRGWTFDSISVDGTNAYRTTYTYPSQELYVMIPKTDTVEAAKEAINAVLNGEELPTPESSN